MKLKVKSHVQQERNMRGFKDKFPTAPPPLGKRTGPYKPKLPEEDGAVNPFAKQLASGDKEVRDATFAALAKWLGVKNEVPLLDMKKIWKGLFYAMWHADGWDVQEALAEQIAGVIHGVKHKVALTYLGLFYITARREWVGIDRHRMDKFLRLVRRVTSHSLRYCANRNWKLDVVEDIAAVFEKAALVAGTKGMVDVGLRLHVSELFVAELRKVASGKDFVQVGCDPDDVNEPNGGAPRTVFRKIKKGKENKSGKNGDGREKPHHKPTLVPSEATECFLNAFATVLQNDKHAPLHDRVLAQVFGGALEGADGGVAQHALLSEAFEFDEDDEDSIDPADRREALAAATMIRLDAATMKRMSRKFIELGALDGVGDLNRESLYAIHTMFKKGAKRAQKATEEGNDVNVKSGKRESGKKRKQEEEVEDEEEEEEDSEDGSEDDLDESFHTAGDDSEEEEEHTPSKRKNLLGKFGDVGDDEFEEADEFGELMDEDEEDEDEEDEEKNDSLDSLDDSDLDNSDSDGKDSESSDEELNSDDDIARHEAAVAAGIAAAERKALRKAERWAAAVGATPPTGLLVSPMKGSFVARRAVGTHNSGTPSSPNSPSKKVLWNLKRNTRHTPTGPPNPVKGDSLRALLNTTPRKSLLNPIHAAAHSALGSDPGQRKPKEEKKKAETMTPGRKKVKASHFFG